MLMAMYYVDSPDAAFTSVYFMLYEACSGYTVVTILLLDSVGFRRSSTAWPSASPQ